MADLLSVAKELDRLCNSHDMEGAVELFDTNATVSMSPAVPGFPTSFRGKDEVRQFMQNLMPGFHVESSNYKVDGDRVTWSSHISSDAFRNLGVDTVEGSATAVIKNNKIVSFTPSFTQDSITKLQAGSARQGTSKGQQPGMGTAGRPPR